MIHLLKYLVIFILLFSLKGYTQNVLVLEKANKRKSYQFREGDKIKVFVAPDSLYLEDRIARIKDSSIVLQRSYYDIPLENIQIVYTKRWGWGFLSELFMKAGIGYAVVGGINQAISGREKDLFKSPLIIGGGLIAAGALFIPLKKHKHKIEYGHWRLVILDFTN